MNTIRPKRVYPIVLAYLAFCAVLAMKGCAVAAGAAAGAVAGAGTGYVAGHNAAKNEEKQSADATK